MVLEGPDLERNSGHGAAPIYRWRSRPAGLSAWPSGWSASCYAGFLVHDLAATAPLSSEEDAVQRLLKTSTW